MNFITVAAGDIAKGYEQEVKEELGAILGRLEKKRPPCLVGVLATADPWAEQYAAWTEKACSRVGVSFILSRTTTLELDATLHALYSDDTVDGVMVYYPIFGPEKDRKQQEQMAPEKDVEGLSSVFQQKLYSNMRYLDPEGHKKCLLPCTSLAIVKTLEYLSVYHPLMPVPYKLRGKTIGVINRSETVGRPLAAMLANDGAKVFSIDRDNIDLYYRYPKESQLQISRFSPSSSPEYLSLVLPMCDVVVTGVPSEHFKVPVHLLKDGVVAINFSSHNNFPPEISTKASIHVPSVGKVTVSMLLRNLLRLYSNRHE